MTGPDGTPDRAADGAPQARLRLLATTDLHMHLTSHDYYAHRPDPSVGLTRTATLIAQARAEAHDTGALVLLFDNGDALQGAPMGDLARTLVEVLQTTGEVDVVFHRTRVHGLR